MPLLFISVLLIWKKILLVTESCFSSLSHMKVKVKLLSRIRLFVTPHCSLPGSSIHGIFQARVLEWVAIADSNLAQASGDS